MKNTQKKRKKIYGDERRCREISKIGERRGLDQNETTQDRKKEKKRAA